MLFSIPIISLLVIGSVAESDYCSQSLTRHLNNRECREYCRIDRPGGDYAQLQLRTWGGCMQACAADPKCVSAQFRPDNGFCYLKSVRNGVIDAPAGYTIDCDPPASTNTTSPNCTSGTRYIQGRTCTTRCNTDRPGGDFASLQARTHEACIQACGTDPKCVTAQYNEATGFCYLKSTRNTAKSVNGQTTFDCDADLYSCGPDTTGCYSPMACAGQSGQFAECLCYHTLDGPTCASSSVSQRIACNTSNECPGGQICAYTYCETPAICVPIITKCVNHQSTKFIFARSSHRAAHANRILS